MKRRAKGGKSRHELQVWTYDQARAAIPYLRSVVGSLREHALAAAAVRRQLEQLDRRPGRPDRAAWIEKEEAGHTLRQAESSFTHAAEELAAIDVFALDAVNGQAIVPFVHDGQLAWYVFDLFDVEPLRFWRFQSDPVETRRPVTAAQKGLANSTSFA